MNPPGLNMRYTSGQEECGEGEKEKEEEERGRGSGVQGHQVQARVHRCGRCREEARVAPMHFLCGRTVFLCSCCGKEFEHLLLLSQIQQQGSRGSSSREFARVFQRQQRTPSLQQRRGWAAKPILVEEKELGWETLEEEEEQEEAAAAAAKEEAEAAAQSSANAERDATFAQVREAASVSSTPRCVLPKTGTPSKLVRRLRMGVTGMSMGVPPHVRETSRERKSMLCRDSAPACSPRWLRRRCAYYTHTHTHTHKWML